jgi:Na+-translocating ferredoxin:NAD+ oxidoreductase RnfE subunit
MKLTEPQIENLYNFTRQHYVEYYDVQTELVDHLANDIEQICVENPNLTFEEARDKSFKKFGIFGFMNVVESKELQMTKKYFKLVLKFAKEWLSLPKIVLTILLLVGFYQLQQYAFGYYIYLGIFITSTITQFIMLINNARKLKRKQKQTQKKWLFEHVLNLQGLGNTSLIFIYFFDFPVSSAKEFLAMGDFKRAFSAILITAFLIITYITLVVIPNKTVELLVQTYPEYKMA